MNLIRGIAKQVTKTSVKAWGLHPPKIYKLSGWFIQRPPIITPNIRFSKTWVSDNICHILSTSTVSANLLPKIPEIHEISEGFTSLEISDHQFIPLAKPAICKLNTCLLEGEIYSENCLETLKTPEVLAKEITNFCEVSIHADLLVPLSTAQVLGSQIVDLEAPKISECCFRENQQHNLEQDKELVENLDRQSESGIKCPASEPSYCEILYPFLLPPLLRELEEQNSLEFYSTLRNYQKVGVKFLFDNSSALLADEMGTGKTVQAVNALRLLFRQGHIRSALIVCPPSVIGDEPLSIKTGSSEGWKGHFYHWAPELKVAILHGENRQKRKENWQKLFHVYITTYHTLVIDLGSQILSDPEQFDCVVLDEAQNIKNSNSQRARAVYNIQAKYRWALTGTPIENRLDDVIALFRFIRPGTFSRNIQYSPTEVSNIIQPFMKRRMKKDVLPQLPDKQPVSITLDLDSDQRRDYDRELESAKKSIKTVFSGSERSRFKMHIFRLLKNLKQICNFARGHSTSPKTFLLLDILKTCIANQEKVLIFSQYLPEGIHKIAQLLTHEGIGHVLYTGELLQQQKAQSIHDFKNKPEISVFLGTFGAASEGITLTEATYVIHFDHPWNPAKINQAEDRAHRIGQTRGVTVYSFWMRNTIEERIKHKLDSKRSLIDATINTLATEVGEDALSAEDWLEIFDIKLGAKKIKAKQLIAQPSFQKRSDKLAPPTDHSQIIDQLKYITQVLNNMNNSNNSSQRIFNIQGNYVEKVEGDYNEHNYAPTQNLAEAAAEIQQLLDQLAKMYPTETDADQSNAVKDIQQKPELLRKIVNALEKGGKKAIEKLVDHPAGAIALAVYEGFREKKP